MNQQNQSINSASGNQQVQAKGSIHGPVVGTGNVSIGGGNTGIVSTSVATREEPQYVFDIPKKIRIPAPASLIGTLSGLITIAGFATGGSSAKELFAVATGSAGGSPTGTPVQYWWLLGSIASIALGAAGFAFFRFLRRHVLWLPKIGLFI